MTNNNPTQPTSFRVTLEQAIQMAKSGRKTEACDQLRRIVALQPVNQAAWLWLSAVAADKDEAQAALAKAREIDPAHIGLPRAEQWFAHRFSDAPLTKKTAVLHKSPSPPPTVESQRVKRPFRLVNSLALGVVVLAVIAGLVVLLFGLSREINAAAQPLAVSALDVERDRGQLNIAQAQRDWAAVIDILDKQYRGQPTAETLQFQLADAYYYQALTQRSRGAIDEALVNLEMADQLVPENAEVQREITLALAYLAGTQHYQAGQWQSAIDELAPLWGKAPDYADVRDVLYSAYFNEALAQQAAGALAEAETALNAAIDLRPDLSTPRRLLTEVEFALASGTPVETFHLVPLEDRLVVVGLAEQRMVVYEGNKQVHEFVVSTGEPGRETITGEFEIQNKIDVAYASTWNLDMPYWMGIYWAGPLQNGIHSLPIEKHTGHKLWDGYLGQRVSYGCVILGDDDAATLYDWAEVGTTVKIVPSLADWSPDQG